VFYTNKLIKGVKMKDRKYIFKKGNWSIYVEPNGVFIEAKHIGYSHLSVVKMSDSTEVIYIMESHISSELPLSVQDFLIENNDINKWKEIR
jgi:hypothetical protein